MIRKYMVKMFKPAFLISSLASFFVVFVFLLPIEKNVKIMDSETKKLLQCYCDGINDYVKSLKILPL